ncbi:ribonuclease H-like domain-containing protein [Peribacillus tepidiphilus]|jgi:uncharacterized protein YprB with RNaseH-like and TPR domain|uniref:ribonuclease H-like domain-containing protein n=1 Tax=Peribacillus tepidiphilus TaxID=2652445 RepID=UPI0035B550BB
MSLKNKLNRMKNHLSLDLDKRVEDLHTPQLQEKIPFWEKWQENATSIYELDGEYCFIREVRYRMDHKHGNYRFSQLMDAVKQWNESKIDHPLSCKGLTHEDLFFFDTETTGLAGGAGTTIFLLGYAFFDGNEVVVKQHILPQPGNEVPLYYSFLNSVQYDTLVTYNGKAFDWPQVKSRHTLIKEHVPKLPSFGHFDLYHASRRLWKDKLEKVKLSIVEKEKLGVHRTEDIPGYLAPYIYFDYLERKDPEALFGVIKHNEWDVLSLICLYIHLSRQILSNPKELNEDSLQVAEWLSYIGEKDAAVQAYETIIHSHLVEENVSAKCSLAREYKRQKRLEEAVELWKEVSTSGNEKQRIESLLELAKWSEHHEKNMEEALRYSREIETELLNYNGYPSRKKEALLKDVAVRIGRLERKRRKTISP